MTMTTTLNAGRAMDALVAEKVMGWTRWEWERGDWDGPADATIFAQHERSLAVYANGEEEPSFWFAPSTDIAAAWQVVERMRDLGWPWGGARWRVSEWTSPRKAEFSAQFEKLNVTVGADAETAPLAICRAALAAVEAQS